jgi:glyoxylase-like metal-dependent hydrolase (beta-lactamase superfamily II)
VVTALKVGLATLLSSMGVLAQTPLEKGTLPKSWLSGGPNCADVPEWQVHQYNPTLYVLRQSGCVNYEKPFLYLFIGRERALLIDTGAGKSTAAAFVGSLLKKRDASVALVVAHSHGHGDHVAGDAGFAEMANATVIPATVEAHQKAFGIAKWPTDIGSIDLGDRVIDVLAIPGHHPAHVAYYDRKTGVLITGDHLYPGRLYVTDFAAYKASTARMIEFTEQRPVAHILGCHIEQSDTPFVDYPVGTVYQPHEHELALSRIHLLALFAGLEKMGSKPEQSTHRDFTIVPRAPRQSKQ